jgi:hypothetical protein
MDKLVGMTGNRNRYQPHVYLETSQKCMFILTYMKLSSRNEELAAIDMLLTQLLYLAMIS